MTAQFLGRAQLDDLEQGVFDHGIGKACGDIRNLRAFLLGLLYIGIHEHRAPGTQVHRVLGKQGLLRKILGRIPQRICKILNKGAAAGGAGLVEHDGIHRAVFQADALHILAANIQHTVHVLIKEGRCRAVGNGLHLALVQIEGGFQQGLAIARRAGAGNAGRAGQDCFQIPDGGFCRLDGVALIVGIEGIEQLPFLADQGHFGGGRARINAQIAVAAVGFQICLFYHSLGVTLPEGFVILLAFKQCRKPGHLKADLDPFFKPPDQILQSHSLAAVLLQGRTHGSEQMGIFRIDYVFRGKLQGADKGLFQLRQEMKRTAQKGNAAPNGLAAGKAGNGLIDNGLKN